MASLQKIDAFAANLDPEVQAAVYNGSSSGTEKRYETLFQDYENPDDLRRLAAKVKQHTLDHLDEYLGKVENQLTQNGAKVHYAWDGNSVKNLVLDIFKQHGAKSVCKSKSMVSEEIDLNHFLIEKGIDVLETDLGEFIVQIDEDHPSHIVKPIIHKNRKDIATSLEKFGLGKYNDDPQTITRRARKYMREKYLQAEVGITGGNFISAESGRLVLVTNEGNSRFLLAGSKVHIALVGIEKIVPSDKDLSLFLNLLARSATGQHLTVYTEFIQGPKNQSQPEGPEEMHVILINNKRTEVLASNCREILRCIRCGACMNVCPVYRQSSGHAYRSVYPGPLGAVLSPLLATSFDKLADLSKASSLCGACNEVCPVDIPIPDLLLKLRNRAKQENIKEALKGTPGMGLWSRLATQPGAWKLALKSANLLNHFPYELLPVPSLKNWTKHRTLPKWQGGKFRDWVKKKKLESKQ